MKTLFKIIISSLVFVSLTFCGNKESGDFNKSFDVKENGILAINLDLGTINIETWDKDIVKISSHNISKKAIKEISIVQTENSIEFDYNGSYARSGNCEFTFYVPEKFNINARTSAGSIELIGKLTGNFEAYTAGGSFNLDDITGNVNINTDGGQIRLQDVGGNLTAETLGGRIDVEDILGKKVKVKTLGGKINIGNVKYKLSAITYGGNIRIQSMGNGSDVKTNGGDIKLRNFDGDVRVITSGGDITVMEGNGYLEAQTSGGDISVKKIIGGVDLHTNAGSIYAEINPDGSIESEIKSGFGEIELIIPKNSNAKIIAKIRINTKQAGHKIKSSFKADSYKEGSSSVQASYKIGSGKSLISVNTNNSDIIIHKK